jgi:hypothetical protein
MMQDRHAIWEDVPEELKSKVIKDWDERTQNHILRGLDHAAHYGFLMWLAKEYETTIEIILSEEEEQ